MNEFIQDLQTGILGTTSIGTLVAYFFWGMIGATMWLLIHLKFRKDKSQKMKWSIFWSENKLRIFGTPLMILIVAKFGPQLIGLMPDDWGKTATDLGDAIYLAIGFLFDFLISQLQKIRSR